MKRKAGMITSPRSTTMKNRVREVAWTPISPPGPALTNQEFALCLSSRVDNRGDNSQVTDEDQPSNPLRI
eukprot:5397380-Heterocapsa_arctica.AAC.1